MQGYIPKALFLTRGVGRHREQLSSFEEALRDAQIARFNLVTVSSIMPPYCKIVSRDEGLKNLSSGEVVFCVMAKSQTDEKGRIIASSIGIAVPKERGQFGYLSEHHSYGQTDSEAGDYAEDLAAQMLATVLAVEFNANTDWSEREQVFRLSGKIVRTLNATQSAIGKRGYWTTTIASAVFCK